MKEVRRSGILRTIPLLITIFSLSLPAYAKYGGGSGTLNDPYLIYTAEQMNAIGINQDDWDKHFKLMADIDLSNYTGADFNIIGYYAYRYSPENKPFSGVFDGQGYVISNFSYNSANADYVGLFMYIKGENAEIRDLVLVSPHITAESRDNIGSMAGFLERGTITGCYVEGGSISGYENVGGLVGENDSGTITNCYSSSNVSGYADVGGLVGENNPNGTIANCCSGGNVSGSWYPVGGLVGANWGTIADCYATSSVSGYCFIGGLVGAQQGNFSTITNCYSTGSVSDIYIWMSSGNGGLVAHSCGEINNSFWDIETSGQLSSVGGTGKTTAEMQDPNTFMDAGWDFVGKPDGPSDVWAEPAGGGYPILWWQLSTLPELPTFSGGTGEPDEPYIVSTAADLNSIGHNPRLMGAHFKLTNDIDLAGIDFYIIGREAFPFTGVFDGNGHTISNFSYTSAPHRTKDIGLFGYIDDPNAEIRDLGLIDPSIDAGTEDSVGLLVGQLWSGTITNCYALGGSVSGASDVGGLVGENNYGTITDCYSRSDVSGDENVGGLVGENNFRSAITNCYSTGSVSGRECVGGLVGLNADRCNINASYSTCTVSGNDYAGGLVGSNGGEITMSYSTGPVGGETGVGGLVGNNNGSVTMSYSTGTVTGDKNLGGLVGSGGGATASFWDIEASGQETSSGGTGKTTAQMHMAVTFPGWGAYGDEGIWTIDEGRDYPRLWWENKPGEVLATELSDFLAGTGTVQNPFLIYTAEELNLIAVFPSQLKKHFKLMADIDLSQYERAEFNVIGMVEAFRGVFDGNGKKITNFDHTRGLFVSVYMGTIKNLGLINVSVDAGTGDCVGLLAGQLNNGTMTNCYVLGGSISGNDGVGCLVGENLGTIINCYSSGSVSGSGEVGGLVGYNSIGGTIADCYSSGDVSGDEDVGGLVGGASGTITNCYSSVDVSGDKSVGGLVGVNNPHGSHGGTITNCYAIGSVSGSSRVGGLVGENLGPANKGTIAHSYSSGSVLGSSGIGGLVGENLGGAIANCYSSGGVSGDENVGGLAGANNLRGSITKCYAIGSVKGTANVGGLVGIANQFGYLGEIMSSFWDIETSGQAESAGGEGKTMAQMQTASTFHEAGWDFVDETDNGIEDIWWILEGREYPRLWWELISEN